MSQVTDSSLILRGHLQVATLAHRVCMVEAKNACKKVKLIKKDVTPELKEHLL